MMAHKFHSTNDGLDDRGRRREVGRACAASTKATIIFALIALVVSITAYSSAQDAPFRDLDAALALLASTQAELDAATFALESAETELLSSTAKHDFLSESEEERLAALETWKQRSRVLAVEAYIAGNDVNSRAFFLAPDSAADLAYQAGLLKQQSEAAVEASLTYAHLVDTSDETMVQLAEAIDTRWMTIESLENEVANAEARVKRVQWIVEIARVHDEADREFASRPYRVEPTEQQWQELRMCESTNNYQVINKLDHFYGAYQFDYDTWFTVGGKAGTRADTSPPEEQDARARLLYARRGAQPWPVCGRFLPGG